MSTPPIRPARPSDADQLARVAEATFRETFGEMNTAEDMDLHCRRSYGTVIQAAEIADPRMRTLVCMEGEQMLAFAQLCSGGAPAGVAGTRPEEIRRFYLVSWSHGTGLAQRLMAACLDELRAHGADTVWLGVWERNHRAIAFYRKCGFTEAGEQRFLLGTDPQRDIVMFRTL